MFDNHQDCSALVLCECRLLLMAVRVLSYDRLSQANLVFPRWMEALKETDYSEISPSAPLECWMHRMLSDVWRLGESF